MSNLFRAALTALLLTSCTALGDAAREDTLLPVAQRMWPEVELYLDRGLEVAQLPGESVGLYEMYRDELDTALESGDLILVASVPWSALEPFALSGIDRMVEAGEVGPNGAVILRQQVHNFTDVLDVLARRAVTLADGELSGRPANYGPLAVRIGRRPVEVGL